MKKEVASILEGLSGDKLTKLDNRSRGMLNKALSSKSFGTYFDNIPIDEIMKIAKSCGLVVVQEDGTEWEGMFSGSSGRATFTLAYYDSEKYVDGILFYTPITNAFLIIS